MQMQFGPREKRPGILVFSARLRELRRAEGLSLRKPGREIGVTANAVLRWEKDEVTPTRSKMLELSRYFGVEPAWLAWGIGARRNRLKPTNWFHNSKSATSRSFVPSAHCWRPLISKVVWATSDQ
ncbi:MAG: helix-turn-helix transcriptional regulator [Pseudomonadales bacterium]|nr:helix-turn-helix transcriptional regulator [Pseudomonadales bacterium]